MIQPASLDLIDEGMRGGIVFGANVTIVLHSSRAAVFVITAGVATVQLK
jgi:hypothetical protein